MSSIDDLSPEKRALISKWAKGGGEPKIAFSSRIPVQSGTGPWPLSFAQQRLWLIDQLLPAMSSAYNIVALCKRFQGSLNMEALKQALTEIMRRHEILRTTFVVVNDQPIQKILSSSLVNFEIIDLQEYSEAEKENKIQQLVSDKIRLTFDLAQGPLWRTSLFQLSKMDFVLLVMMHHSITDDWSCGIFKNELATLYAAYCHGQPSTLPELSIQYTDYAVWQRARLQGNELRNQLVYWKQKLEGVIPVLELPTDHPRSVVQTAHGAKYTVIFPVSLCEFLKVLGQQRGCTLSMVLLAAFQALLSRYTGQDDFCIGIPVAGRNSIELEGLIGCFINTLALRTNLIGNPSFLELLARVRETVLDAYEHQDLPFEQVVTGLQLKRDVNNTPLFQVMMVFLNAPKSALRFEGLVDIPLDIVDRRSAMFNMTLYLEETLNGLRCTMDYDADLFDASTIVRLLGHFQTLTEGVVANPEQRLSELPLLKENERQKILWEWNNTYIDYPKNLSLHKLFEVQVKKTPNHIALIFEEQSLTYSELNQRANQLAHYLQKLGVGPEMLVGIYMERSLDVVIGILGILKAGGAYVPLDPAYPKERIAFMLKDSCPTVLLIQENLASRLPKLSTYIIQLDAEWPTIAKESITNPENVTREDSLAYVIYTSGSTGEPKGVCGPHRGVVNRLCWMWDAYPFEPGEICCQKTALSFVDSIGEIFGPLLKGVCLVVIPDEILKDLNQLVKILSSKGITRIVLVPSLMRALLKSDIKLQDELPKLKLWVSSGESLPNQLGQSFHQKMPKAVLLNLYGSSEIAADVTYYEVSEDLPFSATIPIGRPIANTQIYLLDAYRQPVPIGISGELFVGGDGLARGYLNRPELTEEKFIFNPYSDRPGARLYRTGDLACYLPNGDIVFLGRTDNQVKIRGFRIDVEEIEAALYQYPGLLKVVVTVLDDGERDKSLIAYLVVGAKSLPTVSELREFLREKLPEYMLPSAFMFLADVPLTPSGKVNRKALPAPEGDRPELGNAYVPSRTPSEELLVNIWSKVLGITHVGINDNFFDLGGDSLLVLEVVARSRQVGLHFTPMQIIQFQTIAELARIKGISFTQSEIQAEIFGPLPLTIAQSCTFERDFKDLDHFNGGALIWEVTSPLKPDLLAQAVRLVISHHDGLRSRFVINGKVMRAHIDPLDDSHPFSYIDISEIPHDFHKDVIESIGNDLHYSLDLRSGPLLRFALINLGAAHHQRLLIVLHHFLFDEVSVRILLDDFYTAYDCLSHGKPVGFAPKTTSIQQWTERLHTYARSVELHRELDYWLSLPWARIPSLPLDYPRKTHSNKADSANYLSLSLDDNDTAILLTEIPKYHIGVRDALLMVLVRSLTHWTGGEFALINEINSGRYAIPGADDIDLSRTIGWFSFTSYLVLEQKEMDNPLDAVLEIRKQLLSIPNNGLGYELLLYASGNKQIIKKLKSSHEYDILFNFLGGGQRSNVEKGAFQRAREAGLFRSAREDGGMLQSPHQHPDNKRADVLYCSMSIDKGQFVTRWEYSTTLHKRTTIEAIANDCNKELQTLISYIRTLRKDAKG